jgi:hypothetical protein
VLRSGDGGTTFVPADAGLECCEAVLEGGEQCLFLQATDLEVDSGMLLGNFGALNVFAWNAQRERWELFLGTGELVGCYWQSFDARHFVADRERSTSPPGASSDHSTRHCPRSRPAAWTWS